MPSQCRHPLLPFSVLPWRQRELDSWINRNSHVHARAGWSEMDIFGKRPPCPGPGPGARLKLGLRGTAKQPQLSRPAESQREVDRHHRCFPKILYTKVRGLSGAHPCSPVSRDAEDRKGTVARGHPSCLLLICACSMLDQRRGQTVCSGWCFNNTPLQYPKELMPPSS